MTDIEIIKAGSFEEAVETLASLYPTLIDYDLIARRNDSGKFSRNGHTFQFKVEYTEDFGDEPMGDELGDEEY